MDTTIKWSIVIIIIMGTIIYLNQEVPACIDNPIEKNVTPQTNFSEPVVNELNAQAESNILVFETSGNSMYPEIKDKQKCVCVRSVTYSIGDIVVYFADAGNGFEGIAHKIVSMNDSEIMTKGVNNLEADYPINQNNILCKIPKLKMYELYGI